MLVDTGESTYWTKVSGWSRGASRPASVRFAQRLERSAQLRTEQLGLLPRGEMSSLVDLVEVYEVAVRAPRPGLGRAIHVFRKYRDGDGNCDLVRLLRGGDDDAAARAVLPIQAASGGCGAGEPVQRDVVEHVVPARRRRRIAAIRPTCETRMHEDPCGEPRRRIVRA